jgi:hypothetical protein
MEKYLIDKNERMAQIYLNELKSGVMAINNLIAVYNSENGLKSLTTEAEIRTYLSDPLNYLDRAIINDTGIAVSSVAKPSVIGTANLFNIPYESIKKNLSQYMRYLWVVDHLSFNQGTNDFYLTDKTAEDYLKTFEIYTQTDVEAKVWLFLLDMSKHLSEYARIYDTADYVLHPIAQHYKLEVSKQIFSPTKRSLEFIMDSYFIRTKFES